MGKVYRTFQENDLHDPYIYRFTDKLSTKFRGLPKPKTPEEWEETKKKVVEEEYRRYMRAHNKTVTHRVKVAEPELPTAISEKDFSQHLDTLFQYQLLLWHMNNIYIQAVHKSGISRLERVDRKWQFH